MGKVEGVEFGFYYYKDPNRPIIDYDHPGDQVYKEAVAHACPRGGQAIRVYGEEWTLERYTSCDVVMEKFVLETAERLNPGLLSQLITPVPRKPGEPVGFYEEGRVPDSHLTEMSPGSTSYGYSLPRVIIAAMGRDENGRVAIKHERLPALMDVIEDCITNSKNPYELLAKIAGKSINLGADPKEVLSHIFANGIIDEENCVSQYKEIESALEKHAPALWQTFSMMNPEEKTNNNMWVEGNLK